MMYSRYCNIASEIKSIARWNENYTHTYIYSYECIYVYTSSYFFVITNIYVDRKQKGKMSHC